MLIKREADVDKLDVNESRESTGWAMLGGNRGTCDKCISVAVYMWLPAEIGRQACCYKFACIFYEKCWVMLLKFWHEKIAFVLEINKS